MESYRCYSCDRSKTLEASTDGLATHLQSEASKKMHKQLNHLIAQCFSESSETKKSVANFLQKLQEHHMHDKSFDKVCQILRELDTDVEQVLEIMFRYRMEEKEGEAEEEKIITKDYKVG